MSLLQVSWPLLWRQAAHRRHSQHHRGGQTCAGAWHTSSSIPPIPRPGGHQDAMRLAITPTHHPRALAHHPCCLWSPVEASGGAAGFKSTDLSSIFSAAENSWIWLPATTYAYNIPLSSSVGTPHGAVKVEGAPGAVCWGSCWRVWLVVRVCLLWRASAPSLCFAFACGVGGRTARTGRRGVI